MDSQLEIHRQIYTAARRDYNRKLEKTKATFHRNRIEAANTKELFSIVDNISGSKKSSSIILPNNVEISKLPTVFGDFFSDKIVKIHAKLLNSVPYVEEPASPRCELFVFDAMSLDEVTSIVLKMLSKTCELDPRPTQLVN